jgi:NAD(P)-dependent dehydrogenase (short-subunit alcohol dehydrogenase family)
VDSVRGEIALITGGAQGIGLGIARALAGAGASVVLVDIDGEALRAAEAELSAVTTVATAVLDVRDRLEWLTVVEGVETTLGPIGVLCNNAGVAGRAPVAQMSYEMWDWVLGINLGGVVNGIQTVVPRMVGRGRGHVVNTASGAGLGIPGPGGGAGFLYHSSKYAVVGMSESLRSELAPIGIGVSVLCPGPVATNIQDTSPRTRPGGAPAPSAAFVAARKQLLAAGASPDAVGEMVLRAIVHDELYIHTDRIMEPFVRARSEEILAAMPPA